MRTFPTLRIFLFVVLLVRSAWAGDHANSPAGATMIPPGSSGVAGQLEIDIDEDWFQFVAAPLMVYTIQVNNVSLWDNTFAIRAFADGDDVRLTNSAFTAGASRMVWTNQGGVRSYYIGVSAMFQFTTGTYAVVVSTNDYDGDGDGLADAWELAAFSTTTNTGAGDPDLDGMSTYHEYISGTLPNSGPSVLRITNIVRTVGGTSVAWPSVSFATYRIESTTNLLIPSAWQFITRMSLPQQAGSSLYQDLLGTNAFLHYRIIYE